ncbi:MAG: hypothetical protein IPN94_14865 [Sphingobacteriales bacterium]|nr:hypothetical protein [Sphingobacteriales bacterium]
MQTNSRLIALFCLGILLGAALTILIGRYTQTLYLATDYQPLLKEVGESLEMQITLTEEQISDRLMFFEAKVKRETRGEDKLDSAKNIRKLADDYLTQTQNQINTPQQLKQLYQQMFAKVEKENIQAMTETMPFLQTLNDNTLNNTAVSNKMPQNVKLLYSKLQQLQIKILLATLVDYWSIKADNPIFCQFGTPNYTQSVVIPNATILQQGDTFNLMIGLLSERLQGVTLKVDEKEIIIDKDGFARISRLCDKVGKQEIKGTIVHLQSNGAKTTYPFTQHYTVVKPCR